MDEQKGWTDGQIDKRTDRWANGQKDGQTYRGLLWNTIWA